MHYIVTETDLVVSQNEYFTCKRVYWRCPI